MKRRLVVAGLLVGISFLLFSRAVAAYCNNDGICQSSLGENCENCNDCLPCPTPTPPPSPTTTPVPGNCATCSGPRYCSNGHVYHIVCCINHTGQNLVICDNPDRYCQEEPPCNDNQCSVPENCPDPQQTTCGAGVPPGSICYDVCGSNPVSDVTKDCENGKCVYHCTYASVPTATPVPPTPTPTPIPPPHCYRLSANPSRGVATFTSTLTASCTGYGIHYRWDFDGDGHWDTWSGYRVSHSYNSACHTYHPRVQVRDSKERYSNAVSTSVRSDCLPQCLSLSAQPNTGVKPLSVNFTMTAVDSDGNINRYQWDFDGNNSWDRTTSANHTSYTYRRAGYYTVKGRARDNDGAWSSPPCQTNVLVDDWKDNWLQILGGGFYVGGNFNVNYVPSGDYLLKDQGAVAAGIAWAQANFQLGGRLSQTGWKVGHDGGQLDYAFYDLAAKFEEKASQLRGGSLNHALAAGWYYHPGNLTINSNQSAVPLAILVAGNLTISANVNQLKGIYLATGSFIFNDASGNEGTLTLTGLAVADADRDGQGDFLVRRYLEAGNKNSPAVKIIYQPQLIFQLSDKLWQHQVEVKEILP